MHDAIDNSDPTFFASLSDKALLPSISRLENLRRFRAAGFTHLHLSYKWVKPDPMTEQEIVDWEDPLSESGMRVLDVHGCHPDPPADLSSETKEQRELALGLLRHRIEVTHRLGGDAVVYHVPTRSVAGPHNIAYLVEGLKQVEATARELGICVAMENHYILENDRSALEAVFESFDADFIGFTFDPGHALISGNADWLLRNCGSRLRVLHLNDNNGEGDRHWMPLDSDGKSDWPAIMRFISESGYDKPLQMEICRHPHRYGEHEDFLAKAYETIQTLAGMMDSSA